MSVLSLFLVVGMVSGALALAAVPWRRCARTKCRATSSSSSFSNTSEDQRQRKYGMTLLDSALLLRGKVTTGYGRGSKKLGVPTANLPHFHEDLITSTDLNNGVYFGWGCIEKESETIVPIVANIGRSPTFVGNENSINIVEAHLIGRTPTSKIKDNTGDFYNEYLRVCLIGFLRDEKKFPSFDALVKQIHDDIDTCKYVDEISNEVKYDPVDNWKNILGKYKTLAYNFLVMKDLNYVSSIYFSSTNNNPSLQNNMQINIGNQSLFARMPTNDK